jgi:hypothetical protein
VLTGTRFKAHHLLDSVRAACCVMGRLLRLVFSRVLILVAVFVLLCVPAAVAVGAGVTANGVEQIRSYDNASRLVGIESEKSAVTIEDMSWTLDGVGNPVTLTADGRDETYEYDEMNQLTDACYQALCVSNDPSVSYTYDLVGNRLSEIRRDGMTTVTRDYTYAGDGSDRLEDVDDGTTTENYAYDDNGNATLIADEDATYDQENQMTSLTSGMDTYDYSYGPQGNRVSADDGTTLQEFLWDVNQPNAQLAIERRNSSLHRKYNYGLGRVTTNDGSATSYFLADRVGSTTHVTDASGNVDQTYTYEPFGTG